MSMPQQLGPYEILSPLGKGGMGEVWRARDTRLDRDVAIKVLPESMARDPERVLRFEREAKLLASLNHPNIAQIYGFESSNNTRFLALEYIEGETLAARLNRGPLPIDEALDVCKHIAEALEAAHEKGVIHRDLKPGNVMLTPDGKVKVLDFGLARAMATDSSATGTATDSPTETVRSPTITDDFTRPGIVLGTAAYMSPEQARGRPVDKRTDIWSFGVVLYECLTGDMLFHGETATDSIGAILHKEIKLDRLPPLTPHTVVHVLERCLERDKKSRLRDIGDATIELQAAKAGDSTRTMPRKPRASSRSWGVIAIIALLTAAAASTVTWMLVKPASPIESRPVRLRIAYDEPLDLSGLAYRTLAISPDGSKIVYAAGGGGVTHLYLRRLDAFGSTRIPQTDGGRSPFFAPDGERVGFFAHGLLKWVSLSGGTPLTVAVAPGLNFGGDWLADGRIIFASNVENNLFIVNDDGGEATVFEVKNFPAQPGIFRWPHALPDGKHFLVTYSGAIDGIDGPHTLLVSLDTGAATRMTRGTDAKYVHPGYLLIGQGTDALVVPFDLASLKVTGPAQSFGMKAATDSFGALSAVVSRTGTLVYQPVATRAGGQLAWVERDGRVQLLTETLRTYFSPRLSADDNRIVYWSSGDSWVDSTRIWLHDIARDHSLRLTLERTGSAYPTWTPDERTVVYLQFEKSGFSVRSVKVDGSGEDQALFTSDRARLVTSFAPNGKTGLMYEVNPATNRDIWFWSATDEPHPLINTSFNERAGVISPNGKWFAYVSDQSGVDEIYVTSFPDANGRWLVSTDGGTEPCWSPKGDELFYRIQDRMMAVPVRDGDSFVAGAPVELFRGAFTSDPFGNANYDVSSDGQRFLMVQGQTSTQNVLMVVLNWTTELERRRQQAD